MVNKSLSIARYREFTWHCSDGESTSHDNGTSERKVAHLQSLQAELVRFFKEMEDVTINTSLAYATPHILNVSFVGLKPK